MHSFIRAAIEANETIARKLRYEFDTSWFDKRGIGAGGDESAGIDLFAEGVFIDKLTPFGTIESEESGIVGSGKGHVIVDPIDGSANALSLFPYFGTSVAYINEEGLLEAAVVCNLANGDLFIKEANEEPLRGRLFHEDFVKLTRIEKPEIGLFEKAYANAALATLLEKEGVKYRSPGAVALSLAYAHQVEFVLFSGEVRIYDFAAGLALCEGLEVIVEQDYVIVSQNPHTAKRLEELVLAARQM